MHSEYYRYVIIYIYLHMCVCVYTCRISMRWKLDTQSTQFTAYRHVIIYLYIYMCVFVYILLEFLRDESSIHGVLNTQCINILL